MKYPVSSFSLLLYMYMYVKSACSAQVLQSLEGKVRAENYTYYRLARPGRLKVELVSLSGDADLYISDETQAPTIEIYKQQSTTCGKEMLEIPAQYERPVGIGIYGYPSFEESKFVITISELPKSEMEDYDTLLQIYYNYEDAAYAAGYDDVKPTAKKTTTTTASSKFSASDEDEESEGSIFWHILIDVLKLLLEAVLN